MASCRKVQALVFEKLKRTYVGVFGAFIHVFFRTPVLHNEDEEVNRLKKGLDPFIRCHVKKLNSPLKRC